jgi:hypothetical protein
MNQEVVMKKLAIVFTVGIIFMLAVSTILAQEITRKEVDIPKVDPAAVTIDGKMDEAVWQDAAQANMITATGFEIWANKYYREDLIEPEFDELSARMMWAKDTLFLFVHIDEFVNDSTNLFWPEENQWGGDQLFICLSNRLSTPMVGNYDGNVYAAPDGPYHFLVLGDQVTLNNNAETYIPEEYRGTYADSFAVFNASDICRSATFIDMANGVWDVEMAIYNPNVTAQSSIGFNLGGSCGSDSAYAEFGDAYAYWCWQPNVPDDPYAIPAPGDPGGYTLVNTDYWAILNFKGITTGIYDFNRDSNKPAQFSLSQNYPNPFNPTTTIRFDVAKQGPISLKVYNVLGHEVAVLIDQKIMSIGTYSVTWNAKALSSGAYFYKLEAPGVVEARKMMLLR